MSSVKHFRFIFYITSLVIMLTVVSPLSADSPDIIFTVEDIVLPEGTPETLLDIRMSNFYDSIAGFQFLLESTNPELVTFDFGGNGFDTTGTLISGFELVWALDSLGDGSMILFRCMANLPFDGKITPAFPPQQDGIAVRLPLTITPCVGDLTELTSYLEINKPFDFSDPWGVSIGTVVDTNYDTTFFICQSWEEDSCLQWDSIYNDSMGYDSLRVDTIPYGYLDTTRVIANDGSATVQPGDHKCDNDGNCFVDISDLTCLIEYLFGSFDAIRCSTLNCDPNLSGQEDISDLAYLVEYLFNGGPPP